MKALLSELSGQTSRKFRDGRRFSSKWSGLSGAPKVARPTPTELEQYFDGNTEGAGLWKWRHYFDIYDRHLRKFKGKKPRVLEIGIYSGGSLPMWAAYFGDGTKVIGADIMPECRAYESENVSVYIGDQEDRSFWAKVKKAEARFDVVVDDGGHTSPQQIVTAEEMLGFMNPGGVYICEDIHGDNTGAFSFFAGLADTLHTSSTVKRNPSEPERFLASQPTRFQADVKGISVYPFMAVIEFNEEPQGEFRAPRHGTKWEPFLG